VPGNIRIELGPVAGVSPRRAEERGQVRATTFEIVDDRGLIRRTTWSSVTDRSAFRRTLTCASARGSTLRLKKPVPEGGGVLVQTGRGRGSIEVRVGGAVAVRASTSASKVGKKWIAFTGSGAVDVRVTTAGKRVCVDGARTVQPQVLPTGGIRHLGVNAGGIGPDDEVVNAELSPGGTMVAFWSSATNLIAGAGDGTMRLYIARVSDGRVIDAIATDPSSAGNERALAWSPIFQGDDDARYLAFASHATNLGPNVAGRGSPYLYVKDLESGGVGFLADEVSSAAWSPDGGKIAIVTDAEYGTDTNFGDDIWSLDLNADISANLTSVSTRSDGTFSTSNPNGSWQPSWSPDSTKVSFTSFSSDLVPGDTNGSRDIFMKNLTTGATSRVSLGLNGVQPNSTSEHGTFSPDGRFIAFTSAADNIVSGDTNAGTDVYVRELSSGQTFIISTNSRGEPSLFDHYRPHWSPDQTRIAFMSEGVDLLPTAVDVNQRTDVYVKNLASGVNQVVSITADGRFGNADSTTFIGEYSNNAWMPNGRGIVFISRASNLAITENNGNNRDLFLKPL
jgi:Tol biopolymer transport system component